MINIIWCAFVVVGIIYFIITGNFEAINTEILESAETSLNMIMKLFPVLALWLGIMNIAKESGLLKKISKILSPIFLKLFPLLIRNIFIKVLVFYVVN